MRRGMRHVFRRYADTDSREFGCDSLDTEFVHAGLTLQQNLFGSTFFVLTGFHGGHVALGIAFLLTLWILERRGQLTTGDAIKVEVVGLYWHFVDVVWIVIFTVVYLVP